jgi:hemerythrin-like domain-containing protein
MSHRTLTIIRAEHQALSAMLTSLSMLLAEYRRKGSPPDFALLRAMLLYVDEFPEKLHHTKESELLFPLLRARSPEAAEVLDRLDREHANGEKAIRDLEHELLAFEVLGGSRGVDFEQSVNRYVEFYLAHMALEETEVLPLAKRVLSANDWLEIDAAFEKNRDPLTGHEPDDVYRPLFTRISMVVPAPIGLGPAIE